MKSDRYFSFRKLVKMIDKIIRTAGHLYCTLALYLASLLIEWLEFLIRKLVSIVTAITGIEDKKPKVSLDKSYIENLSICSVSLGYKLIAQNQSGLRSIS